MTDHRVRAYVGLGANVGDASATLASAIVSLGGLPRARLHRVSRLYATRPVGVADQPEFRNAVAAIDVPAGPDPATGALRLLTSLKDLERAFGRRRRRRWGPRELDLDLLVFGRARLAIVRPPEARSLDADADPTADPSADPTVEQTVEQTADADPTAAPTADATPAQAAAPTADATPAQAAATSLLIVPHPSADQRLFVLAPLADLAPGLVPPGWGVSVETARRRQSTLEGPDAVRVIGAWDPATCAWRPTQSA